MQAIVEQMIHDATAAVNGDPKATDDVRALVDPVKAGERSNYRGTMIPRLDLLGLYLPRPGMICKFLLIVHPGTGRHNSPTYAVTQEGDLREAKFVGGELVLIPVDFGTTTWLAAHILDARS